jgi:3-dehydroquinate dehydratase
VNLGQFSGSGKTPVKLEYPLTESYKYKVEIPKGYELFTPPVDLEIQNDLGELKIHISQSGQTVTIIRSYHNLKDVISSDNMDEFQSMLTAWENANWRKIVVKVR